MPIDIPPQNLRVSSYHVMVQWRIDKKFPIAVR